MRVLMITGDKRMTTPGTFAHERFLMQKSQVEVLDLLLWPQEGILKPLFVVGKYDIVTSQDPFWRGLIAWIAARRLSAKLNIQVHADLDAQSLIKHVLAQIILRHADSIRVVSEQIKKQVEHIGVRARISILPIFVDLDKFRSAVPKPHPQKNIFWMGRFEPEKDPLLAIEVLKEVRESDPNVKLLMLGDGSMKEDLIKNAKDLPVEFPGWQHEILPYMEVSDVMLSTSPAESFGSSIIEALAAGVPVVSLDVGIAREAGAIIAERNELANKVTDVLAAGVRGQLQIKLLNKVEWALAWKKTL
jgi:glycosyltransferase involved in cell wall biosynthesis